MRVEWRQFWFWLVVKAVGVARGPAGLAWGPAGLAVKEEEGQGLGMDELLEGMGSCWLE